MSTPSAPEATASNWQQLYFFKVIAERNADSGYREYPLFNNGQQQLHITLQLAALTAAGQPAVIPAQELVEARLIDFLTSAELPRWDNGLAGSWAAEPSKGPFTYDRNFINSVRSFAADAPINIVVPAPAEDERVPTAWKEALSTNAMGERNARLTVGSHPFSEDERAMIQRQYPGLQVTDYQFVDFYVVTRATQGRTVAGRITNSQGTVFRTNHGEIGDDSGLGDGLGKFNSSIRIDPVTFPNLPGENYGDRNADGTLKDTLVATADNYAYRCYEHHINIKLPNGKMVPIHSIWEAYELWGDGGTGWKACLSHTYIGGPGSRTMEYLIPPYVGIRGSFPRSDEALRDLVPDLQIRYPREGQIVIGHVLCIWDYWFYLKPSNGERAPHRLSSRIGFTDIYGNPHSVTIFFSPRYYNYINISK